MADEDLESLKSLAEEKINFGTRLYEKLNGLKEINGVTKVQRKILQELKFLKKVVSTNSIKVQHLQCSNLTFYNFLVENIFACNCVKYVEYPLHVPNRKQPLKIDIICDNGLTWIKVISRSDVPYEPTKYGAKSILDYANEYKSAAEDNLCFFQKPKIIFKFANSICDELKNALNEIDVIVCQKNDNLINNSMNSNLNDKKTIIIDKLNNKFSQENNLNILNLDTSTILAYISELTNGGDVKRFNEKVLNELAECERKTHVKLKLIKFFENKTLICCETAINSVKEIVRTLGGPNEKKRFEEFLKIIEIFPDPDEIDLNLTNIEFTHKIKRRSLIIFSFGLQKKAITVTSNVGFIRSMKMQGVDIPTFIHEARALTELKELPND